MPNAAEAFLIVIVVIVIFAAARLLTLGDALGQLLRNLVGRGKNNDAPSENKPESEEKLEPEKAGEKKESGEGTWQSGD